ncbi:MAG: Flp family type IVb pilin [Acidimicrobiia bacterium]
MSRFFRDDRGAGIVEYAFLLALVLLVTLVALTAIGIETNGMVDDPNLTTALT